MANIGRMLGMLLATRMAGRGKFGSALGTAALMRGGLASKAGLAGLGYMAYRAWQDSKAKSAEASTAAAGQHGDAVRPAEREQASNGGIGGTIGGIIDSLTGGQTGSNRGETGLGDRVRNYFDPASAEPARGGEATPPPLPAGDTGAPAPEGARIDDTQALLLIRAMIAAANADGHISPEERRRIVGQLDQAGADAEDHRLIEQELANPKPLDTLLAQVQGHDTAQQFYAASRAAMDGESPTQKSYLDYLRNRLNLPPTETTQIDQAMQ